MSDNREWDKVMNQAATAVARAEDQAVTVAALLAQCQALIARAENDPEGLGLVVLDSMRLGFGLHEGIEWAATVPGQVENARVTLAQNDARVAAGELPAAAHSWRHQLAKRLQVLDAKMKALNSGFEDVKAVLERTHSSP